MAKRKSSERSVGTEKFCAQFALTNIDDKTGTFKGIASVFGNLVDTWMPTVIEKGAFSKTLKDRKRPVKILYQHDTHQPIGVPISLKETDVGLEIEGKISQTPFGQEVLTLCRDGVLDGLSIGFDPIKWEMEQEEGKDTIRRVKEVLLYEVSIVTFGADSQARINEVNEFQSVVPYADLPLADDARAWDKAAADKRVTDWAGGGDKIEEMDWAKYRRAHVWYDGEDTEKKGSYKLLIADIIDGKLTAVPRAVFAAAVVGGGGRGGRHIPDADLPKVRTHLGKYYTKMDRTPPWEAEKESLRTILEPCASIEILEGKVLSAKNAELVRGAIAALNALLQAAEPPPQSQGDNEQALTVRLEHLRTAQIALAQMSLN